MTTKIVVTLILVHTMLLSIPFSESVSQPAPISRCTAEFSGVEDIYSSDGGYHYSENLTVEWWYFDAVLDQNFSIHIGLMLLSTKNHGIIVPGINIYEHGKNIYHRREIRLLQTFTGSVDEPKLFISGVSFIDGWIDYETGLSEYWVNLSLRGASVSLLFSSLMHGWKVDTYAIIMPKATVHGTLVYEDEIISVFGEGYHEHHWNVPLKTLVENNGYYWGHVSSDNTKLVWTQIHQRTGEFKKIAVVNYGSSIIIPLDPDDFILQIIDEGSKLHKNIPTKYQIIIDSEDVSMNVSLSAIDYDFVNVLVLKYYRFFMFISGAISINGVIAEDIAGYSFMEYTKYL